MPRALVLPTVAVALLLLTSCSPSGAESPTPSTSASPSASAAEPIFESEEEAVAAADAVIAEYWLIANAVLQAGGEGVERFEVVVTPRRMQAERATAEVLLREGFHQEGSFEVSRPEFQQILETDGEVRVIVTTCVDYSDVRMINDEGLEAERSNSAPRMLHEVELHVTAGTSSPTVLLDRSELWAGTSC